MNENNWLLVCLNFGVRRNGGGRKKDSDQPKTNEYSAITNQIVVVFVFIYCSSVFAGCVRSTYWTQYLSTSSYNVTGYTPFSRTRPAASPSFFLSKATLTDHLLHQRLHQHPPWFPLQRCSKKNILAVYSSWKCNDENALKHCRITKNTVKLYKNLVLGVRINNWNQIFDN